MSSISSINGSGAGAMYGGMKALQKPDTAKMAEDLFSKLDTKGQGYIEKSDLQAALSNVSGSDSSSNSSADDLFAKLDGDGDGKVTQSEMQATLEKLASELDGPFPKMRMQGQGDMPPPPPGGEDDSGLTKDQLSSMSEKLSATDSEGSQTLSDIAANFDAADSNGDGKVSASEAKAYEDAKNTSGSDSASADSATTTASAGTSSLDQQFMKQMMQLIHAYGGGGDRDRNGAGISTTA